MLQMQAPSVWNVHVKGNEDVKIDVEFEKYLISVAENTNQDIDNLTVFQFYSLTEYIKEQNKKNQRKFN